MDETTTQQPARERSEEFLQAADRAHDALKREPHYPYTTAQYRRLQDLEQVQERARGVWF